jgi:ubiquinone/menaquinone biosynthesis C-methylase UbiE
MVTVDFKRLRLTSGDRILDIGCGSGRHCGAALQFKELYIVGGDRNPTELHAAEDRLRWLADNGLHKGGSWTWVTTDALRLPFAKQSFDLVICSEVLEHVPQDRQFFNELLRVLKPDRNLVVSVPRAWPERLCWRLSADYQQAEGGHIRIYLKKRLFALMRSCGLLIEDWHYAHSLHAPYWWLKCLLPKGGRSQRLLDLYHRLLVWEIMSQPPGLRLLDRLLNPVMGKSLVVYAHKPQDYH